jgi:hypothetical protein
MYKIIYNILIRSPKMETVLTYSNLITAIEVARDYAKELHAQDSVTTPICYIIDSAMGDTNSNTTIWYYEEGKNLVKVMRSRLRE